MNFQGRYREIPWMLPWAMALIGHVTSKENFGSRATSPMLMPLLPLKVLLGRLLMAVILKWGCLLNLTESNNVVMRFPCSCLLFSHE